MAIADTEKSVLTGNINHYNSKIRHYEDLYDSLISFKRNVETSEEEFRTMNSNAKNIVQNLSSIQNNTPPAQTYMEGMSYSLSGIGSDLCCVAFDALETMIEVKKTEYRIAIKELELARDADQAALDALNLVAFSEG